MDRVNLMKCIILIVFLLCSSHFSCAQPPAITFKGGGRLGDKLMVYCKAKWFAYKHGVQFFCPDFPYKDQLRLSGSDKRLTQEVEKTYRYRKIIKHEQELFPIQNDILYIVDFYAVSDEMSDIVTMKNVFNAHPDFMSELRHCISPYKSLDSFTLPKDVVSVAVHVRKGSGSDISLSTKELHEYAQKKWPTKFPSDEFYLNQIQELSAILNHPQLCIYLFTDYHNPSELAAYYKKTLNLKNVSLQYRIQQGSYEETTIDDMLAMAQFQYLVRPYSLYSAISYLLGDHDYMVFPIDGVWNGQKTVINKIFKAIRGENGIIGKHIIVKRDE